MTMFRILTVTLMLLFLGGCGNLSPRQDQEIDNQNGRIEELKNNQNGLMLDLLKLRNQQEITARDVGQLQQGMFNKQNTNTGVQVLQGDGALVLVFGLGTIGLLLIFHYRSKYVSADQTANILAEQVALYDDINLDNAVFMSALNTEVEEDLYHRMVQAQTRTGTMRGVRVQSMRDKKRS